MTADFDQLVDLTGLGPEERDRLLRVHELLVAAGPPAELPAGLDHPPTDVETRRLSIAAAPSAAIPTAATPTGPAAGGAPSSVIPFPVRRRAGAALLIAATVAAACFGGGYLLANQTHSSALHAVRVVQLQGSQGPVNSQAALRVGSADSSGNWPIQLTVTGLPPLPNERSRYYLMVWQDGKPVALCGTFEVGASGSTTVTFNVAYKITKSTRWVVTRMAPGLQYPGHVVMTTS